ncbi:MAG: aminoacyl-tRNA hydrolase [Candidatus Saccharibacteria bacterium]
MKIIFAQGNPGPEYTQSRHNIGFLVVDSLIAKYEADWINKPKFQAFLAQIYINSEKVLLVKPNTFYNETGASARKLLDFYKLDPTKDLLVVHDDLALPFGTIRVRKQGSDAGNNGIKSINSHLDQNYARIRIGIDNEFREIMGDSEFVLANFRNNETRQIKKTIVPQTIELIEQFCDGNLKITSHKL